MRRRSKIVLAGTMWLVAVVVLAGLFAIGLVPHLSRAYCAAWLVLVSLPLGALPALMLLDLAGAGETSVSAPLRLLLASLPILAFLIAPVLLDYGHIYSSTPTHPVHGFATAWFTRDAFTLRAVVYLVIWVVLALFFVRPEPPRRAFAGFGLVVHLVIGTLAAYDWFMSLDAGFTSSVYGLLVIAVQCAFAVTVAALIALFIGRRAGPDRDAVLALLAVAGIAAFVQFAQYLVIWSANLPKEIVWYQTRATDILGPTFSLCAPVVLALAVIALMPERFSTRRAPLTIALTALCAVEIGNIILLASPDEGFTVPRVLVDGVVCIVIAGFAAACAVFVSGRLSASVGHG